MDNTRDIKRQDIPEKISDCTVVRNCHLISFLSVNNTLEFMDSKDEVDERWEVVVCFVDISGIVHHHYFSIS